MMLMTAARLVMAVEDRGHEECLVAGLLQKPASCHEAEEEALKMLS